MPTENYIKKEVSCENHGKKIYGISCIPTGEDRKMPAVIFSHGYNSSHKSLLPFAEYLAGRGIVSYCYDFCGGSSSSQSQGSTTQMTIFTEQEDLNAVIDMITTWDCVDKSKLFLFGESQGGLVSAITAGERKDAVLAIMLLFPALCIPDDGRKKFKNISDIPDEMEFMGMKLGKNYYEAIADYNTYEHIGKFDKNVLIFHGDHDTLVDISYSKKALQVFPAAKLKVFQGEGHGFSKEGNDKVAELSYEFIRKFV